MICGNMSCVIQKSTDLHYVNRQLNATFLALKEFDTSDGFIN